MKKITTIFLSILLISNITYAQYGFYLGYSTGNLDRVHLTNSSFYFIGISQSNIGASDFGPGDILFAINSSTEDFIQIDTTNASTTLVSNMPAPTNHTWTGMAFDPLTGIMYGISSSDTASTLHNINCSNGTYTTISTQTTAPEIACIGIDDSGQMYGLKPSSSSGTIFLIDKTNGAATYLGSIGHPATGNTHGMDFCEIDTSMYITFANIPINQFYLSTVDLSTGAATTVGYTSGAKATFSVRPYPYPLTAFFTADNTTVCEGDTVNFTNTSNGATSWDWTFEGGTPATSTDQNPVVVYNTSGVYDVSLIVSNTNESDTTSVSDMITVNTIPIQPDTPIGEIEVCSSGEYNYTTQSVPGADLYTWELLPTDAGTLTGTDTSALFMASETWTGAYTVKVKAHNSCGVSPWSAELSCTLHIAPVFFFVEGGGPFCVGGSGSEITLDGSETGVDYDLYLEGVSTGTIIQGTGSPLSFGLQTDEGLYTVIGATTYCSETMYGEAYVYEIIEPIQGTQPTGPDVVCAGTTTDYQTDPIPDADTLIWDLKPDEGGVITGSGENISIIWEETYSGSAYLSVYGSNECGDGAPSDDLEISVSSSPEPEIEGDTLVCNEHQVTYTTPFNPNNTYTWSVEGGSVVVGAGTNEVDVLWATIGDGYVTVTEIPPSNCQQASDTLLILIDDCTGFVENLTSNLIIYPNPANEVITISSESNYSIEGKLHIYNMKGQLILQASLNLSNGNKSQKLNISSLEKGMYVITITTSNNFTRQFNIEVY